MYQVFFLVRLNRLRMPELVDMLCVNRGSMTAADKMVIKSFINRAVTEQGLLRRVFTVESVLTMDEEDLRLLIDMEIKHNGLDRFIEAYSPGHVLDVPLSHYCRVSERVAGSKRDRKKKGTPA